jgi:hypothetical protein
MNKRNFLSEVFDGGVKFQKFISDIIYEYPESLLPDEFISDD